jgi:hypothetical protein
MNSHQPTTPREQLSHIHAQKSVILSIPHWNAIPELCADMNTLNHVERQLRRTLGPEQPAPKPTPRAESHHLIRGDRVRHPTYGDGKVTFVELSGRLREWIVTAEYESGESHSCFVEDLSYIPPEVK